MAGKLIVIEGTDGSGKETQSRRLLERLAEAGIPTAYFDFPRHGEKPAAMVDNYLNGKYGPAAEVGSKAASVFYAVDRYDASFEIRKNLEEGKIVICNRYVSANMGHQGGKIKDRTARKEYLGWLEDLEYNIFGIPKPDLVVLLYVPYLIGQELVRNKAKRDYIVGSNMDIHEADPSHLKDAAVAFLEVAKEKGWKVIDCAKDGKILPIEEIHKMLWADVQELL
jgi:dTMP kinase